jgi:hypothetical protein
MNDPIEPLAHEHDDECKCKERQSINMTQPQIVGEKITHVRAKNTGEAERGPVSGAQLRKVDRLHGVTLWRDVQLQSTSRWGLVRGESIGTGAGYDIGRTQTFWKELNGKRKWHQHDSSSQASGRLRPFASIVCPS